MNHLTPRFKSSDTDEECDAGRVTLQKAVSHMVVATESQKGRVREFQTVMKDLQASVDKLGRTCEAFHRRLGRIRIRRLQHHSLALVQTMEGSLGPRLVSG